MINNKKHKYVEPFEPNIADGQAIPALKWEDTYRYLGVKLGNGMTSVEGRGVGEAGREGGG